MGGQCNCLGNEVLCDWCHKDNQIANLRAENARYRAALKKINLGRHGSMTTVDMALVAWVALYPKEKP